MLCDGAPDVVSRKPDALPPLNNCHSRAPAPRNARAALFSSTSLNWNHTFVFCNRRLSLSTTSSQCLPVSEFPSFSRLNNNPPHVCGTSLPFIPDGCLGCCHLFAAVNNAEQYNFRKGHQITFLSLSRKPIMLHKLEVCFLWRHGTEKLVRNAKQEIAFVPAVIFI